MPRTKKRKTYPKKPCIICRRLIAINGCAQSAHMREHVEKGEADEIEWQKIRRWRDENRVLQTDPPIDSDYDYQRGSGKLLLRQRYYK